MLKKALFAVAGLPRGHSPVHDLRKLNPRIVFDVGANAGQSVRTYLKAFPSIEILYSFEPVAATFRQLERRYGNHRKVSVHQMAIGSNPGHAKMRTDGELSGLFRIEEDGKESVQIETLDRFTAAHGVEFIDFLKIDTEGHDLEVLKGAENLLRHKRMRFVQVEAGMAPDNDLHAPFDELKSHMDERGYHVFGIYEQWSWDKPWLARANVIFCCSA